VIRYSRDCLAVIQIETRAPTARELQSLENCSFPKLLRKSDVPAVCQVGTCDFSRQHVVRISLPSWDDPILLITSPLSRG
jgi:hypothetical protein